MRQMGNGTWTSAQNPEPYENADLDFFSGAASRQRRLR